jgi:hypothetical protein
MVPHLIVLRGGIGKKQREAAAAEIAVFQATLVEESLRPAT